LPVGREFRCAASLAERLFIETLAYVWSVAFAPDGQTLAGGTDDGMVRLWDVLNGAIWYERSGHRGPVRCVAFTPDGRTLASGSTDKTVRLWNAHHGTLKYALHGHVGAVHSVAFSADGHVLASVGEDRTVRLWEVADGTSWHGADQAKGL